MTTPPPQPPQQPYGPPPDPSQQPNQPYGPPPQPNQPYNPAAPGGEYGGGYGGGYGPAGPGGYPPQQPPPGYGPPGSPPTGPGFGPTGPPPGRRRGPLLITTAVVVALVVVLGGGFGWPGWFTGGDTDSSDPGSVAQAFADAVNAHDVDAAVKLWCEATPRGLTEDLNNSERTPRISLTGEPHVEGNAATQPVTVRVTGHGHTSESNASMKLTKTDDGQWCVAGFGSSTGPANKGSVAAPVPSPNAPTSSSGPEFGSGKEAATELIQAINDADSDAAHALVCKDEPEADSSVDEMLSTGGHAELTGSGGPETPMTVAYIAEVTNDEKGKVWKYWLTFSKDEGFCLMDVMSEGPSNTVPGASLTAEAKRIMRKLINAVNGRDSATALGMVCPDKSLTKDDISEMIEDGNKILSFRVYGKIEGAVDFEYEYRDEYDRSSTGLATISRFDGPWCVSHF